MTFLRTAIVGAAMVAALAGTVRAQGDSGSQQISDFQLMNGRVIVVSPQGYAALRYVPAPDMLAEIMRDARPMSTGSILAMRDGKLYAAPDRPMPGGTMLSEMITRSTAR